MKKLVAYFSANGHTAKVAKLLAERLGADLFEIRPEEPYTKKDLNWMNPLSRTTKEMHKKSFRPAMVREELKVEAYDEIYLGFPIWWYIAPTIVNTFLESCDFSGKTITLFATSGGSGFGKTVMHLRPSLPESTKLVEGRVINTKTAEQVIAEWIKNP